MSGWLGGSNAQSELQTLAPLADFPKAVTATEHLSRLSKVRALTGQRGYDAILISAGSSLRYFTGIDWGATERLVALLLPVDGDPVYICPEFERATLAQSALVPAEIAGWEEHESPAQLLADILNQRSITRLAVDPALAFGAAQTIVSAATTTRIEACGALIDACRSRKSPVEIALMQHAKNITIEVQRRAARILRPGISTAEVRTFIDQAHRQLGAAGSTFCIVLFGEATSYPHGVPYQQQLAKGDVVLIDTGCRIAGYNSDITRSYVFGSPSAEVNRLWELERAAQYAAFGAAQIGRTCSSVDDAARACLEAGGLGPDYALPGLPHRTGHGIGLDIHESPNLVRGDMTPLAQGMCFSNEPMIVVPGRFGLRLEDHFYMGESGPHWFTEPARAIDAPFH